MRNLTGLTMVPKFQAEGRANKLYGYASWVICVLGMALRVIVYLQHGSLSHDEACVGLNLMYRPYLGLMRALDFEQAAPVGFLWASKLLVSMLGPSEYVLRFIPLIASLAFLYLLRRFAFDFLGAKGSVPAVLLGAAAPLAIEYAGITKQYASDALITLIVVAAGAALLTAPEERLRWRRMAWAGAAGLLFSQVAIFSLAAVGAALLADRRFREEYFRKATIMVTLWVVEFGCLYALSYRYASQNPYLKRFWEAAMLSGNGHPMASLKRVVWDLFGSNYLTVLPARVFVLLFLIGLYAIWRLKGAPIALLFGLPHVLLVGAGLAGQYPVAERLILFICPLLFLTIGAGISFLLDQIPARWNGWVAVAALGGLSIATAQAAIRDVGILSPPGAANDIQGALTRFVNPNHDPVYVLPGAIPVWFFYTTRWAPPDPERYTWFRNAYHFGGEAFADTPSRMGKPVEGGEDLVRTTMGRIEMLGLSTGIESRVGHDILKEKLDPGWTEHEANRIHALGNHDFWIFTKGAPAAEASGLVAELTKEGASETLEVPEEVAQKKVFLRHLHWVAEGR